MKDVYKIQYYAGTSDGEAGQVIATFEVPFDYDGNYKEDPEGISPDQVGLDVSLAFAKDPEHVAWLAANPNWHSGTEWFCQEDDGNEFENPDYEGE